MKIKIKKKAKLSGIKIKLKDGESKYNSFQNNR